MMAGALHSFGDIASRRPDDLAAASLLASAFGANGRARIADILRDPREGALLIGAAIDHGLVGQLHLLAPRAPSSRHPDLGHQDLAHEKLGLVRLKRAFDQQTAKNCVLEHATSQAIEALAGGGVAACVLKGPHLGHRIYGHIGARKSTDIDLLVHPRDLRRAVMALESLGYRQMPGMATVPRGGGRTTFGAALSAKACLALRNAARLEGPHRPVLELHHRVHLGFGHPLEAEAFLARAVETTTVDGRSMRVLAPEDEWLYLIVHAAGHRFALGWLVDLVAFVAAEPRLRFEVVRARAEALRVWQSVDIALEILKRLLGFSRPPALASSRGARLRAEVVLGFGAPLGREDMAARLAARLALSDSSTAAVVDVASRLAARCLA